ncbi:MAG: indole-3-glycerol phosphate synthase TrpC [Acidobacteriota bacterium]|nr:indole-3-glycerol phosphate synthase TrpC [Acidobacteriota bacterium]
MTAGSPDLLEAIVGATRARVASSQAREARPALERRAMERSPDGAGFVAALSRMDRVNVIAECKRRSPSRGILRAAYEPAHIASGYERAGAAAISVLTEPGFFDGSLAHLESVRAAVRIPLLRKDFIVDDYQLLEARAAGADAILLIVAALNDADLRRLAAAADQLGLAALVEVHSAQECERALACTGGDKPSTFAPCATADKSGLSVVIGVNNRNLRTLQVDLEASHVIARSLPRDVVAISESGLKTPDDLRAMTSLGYKAFLIGERFMVAPDPGAALAHLLESLKQGSPASPERGARPGPGLVPSRREPV